MIWRISFGLFLIAHGLVHLLYVIPTPAQEPGKSPWPFSLTKTWLVLPPETLKLIGITLVAITVISYAICGIGILFFALSANWVYWVGIIASIFSIILMTIFWNNNFVFGILLSIGVLIWFFTKVPR